jgi:hypothetical protein
VGIGRHRNQDFRFVREARILSRKIQAVGAGIDLEETAGLFRVLNNTLDVEFLAWTLEEKAAGCMPEDVEIAVIHGVQDSLGLLALSKREARMHRADRIIQFP